MSLPDWKAYREHLISKARRLFAIDNLLQRLEDLERNQDLRRDERELSLMSLLDEFWRLCRRVSDQDELFDYYYQLMLDHFERWVVERVESQDIRLEEVRSGKRAHDPRWGHAYVEVINENLNRRVLVCKFPECYTRVLSLYGRLAKFEAKLPKPDRYFTKQIAKFKEQLVRTGLR